MMIGAEHVQQVFKAALELVEHVRDIGGEIRARAIFAHHHAVLFVAERGAAKPQRAILQVRVAGLLELRQRSIDRAVLVQAALGKPGVEMHAELAEVIADVAKDVLEREVQHPPQALDAEQRAGARDQRIDVQILVAALRLIRRQIAKHLGRASRQLAADRRIQALGDRDNVVAAIAIGRKDKLFAAQPQILQPGAGREDVHLAAGVINVVLALDLVADGGEQVSERRAESCMPPMTDVQGSGRIGRDEFDHQRLAFP